ncbi:MAG: hypothetical protein PHH63_08100 [Bacteroidales bacterium]|jgi:hypothetical protein|nr:hypothetical protein [Bacteroidales bacterium]MDD3161496.1 hypothetical protein [Bacteroidales bacterium]
MKAALGFIALCLMCICTSCSSLLKESFEVSVHLNNYADSILYVFSKAGDTIVPDTIKRDTDSLFHFQTTEMQTNLIVFVSSLDNGFISVYPDKDQPTISVEGDATFPELAQVRGGVLNDSLSLFKSGADALLRQYCAYNHRLEKAWRRDSIALADSLYRSDSYIQLQRKVCVSVGAYIKQHPTSISSLYLVRDFCTMKILPGAFDSLLLIPQKPLISDPLFQSLKQISRSDSDSVKIVQ